MGSEPHPTMSVPVKTVVAVAPFRKRACMPAFSGLTWMVRAECLGRADRSCARTSKRETVLTRNAAYGGARYETPVLARGTVPRVRILLPPPVDLFAIILHHSP